MEQDQAGALARYIEIIQEALPPEAIEAQLALGGIVGIVHERDQAATTDTLTGLPNLAMMRQRDNDDDLYRRHAEAGSSEREPSRATRGITGHYVEYLDVDKFKEVNDTLGHEVGDRVLRVISTALRFSLRPEDEIYRIGGDEFMTVIGITESEEHDPEASFDGKLASRLNASVQYLLTEQGAEYLSADLRNLSAEDRVALQTIGWTIGENYVPGHYLKRTEARIPAETQMRQRKEERGTGR